MPENDDCCKERSCIFMKCIYQEKNLHKNHRFSLVQRKLFFMGALLGVGSINLLNANSSINFSNIAYLVPLVAIAYDIFILAEDFKIKRIGVFIRYSLNTCPDENFWEKYVSKNREISASYGSAFLTFLSYFAAVIINLNGKSSGEIFYLWVFISPFLIIIPFIVHSLNWRRLNQSKDIMDLNPKLGPCPVCDGAGKLVTGYGAICTEIVEMVKKCPACEGKGFLEPNSSREGQLDIIPKID